MNKRGFIKTLEAVLAVIVVFIFIVTLGQSSGGDRTVATMKGIQEGLLTGISQTDEYRSCIIVSPDFVFGGTGGVNPCVGLDLKTYVEDTLPNRFKERYVVQACEVEKCNLPSGIEGSNVYTSAVIISSDLEGQTYKPKIFRIWMW